MPQPQIYEGTAEEIAEQLRVSRLVGRLKAIVTPDETPRQNGNIPSLADTLADFLEEVDQTEFTPGKPLSDPLEKEVGRLIAAKFARQGHTK
jgi:hypothetical protein